MGCLDLLLDWLLFDWLISLLFGRGDAAPDNPELSLRISMLLTGLAILASIGCWVWYTLFAPTNTALQTTAIVLGGVSVVLLLFTLYYWVKSR